MTKTLLGNDPCTNARNFKAPRSDQAMIDLQPHVGLSHARLSIRDLKSGIQPMTRTFHGKTCSIVYNGEIYNHRELLPELQAAGYRFTTTSDTEIILCAYMHFGKILLKN